MSHSCVSKCAHDIPAGSLAEEQIRYDIMMEDDIAGDIRRVQCTLGTEYVSTQSSILLTYYQ